MGMASRAFLTTMIVAAVVVAPALAADYVVGDEARWNLGVNYTAWAKGKDFRVGDTITFLYNPADHNVLKVNEPDFQKCASSNASAIPSTSGHDMFTLATPGKKWYICDIGNHCSQGMKLVIAVSPTEGPAPAPWLVAPTPDSSAASEKSNPFMRSCFWMLAFIATTYKMIMA